MVLYGGLLVLTPVFYGVLLGRLPTEISHRGARWSEVADEALGTFENAINSLQIDSSDLRAKLVQQELRLDRPVRGTSGRHALIETAA